MNAHEPDELTPLKLLIRGVGQCRTATKPNAVQQRSTATRAIGNASGRLPPTSDLPYRPRTTTLPRVRIEGVRGSNPLSSTSRAGFERRIGSFWLPYSNASHRASRRARWGALLVLAVGALARTCMNPGELVPLQLLIRGFQAITQVIGEHGAIRLIEHYASYSFISLKSPMESSIMFQFCP